MNRFSRSSALPLLAACALLHLPSSSLAAAPDSAALFPDPVIATGKGFEIKRSQLDNALANFSADLARSGRVITDADRPNVRSNLLQHLITDKLLVQRATDEDKTKARQEVNTYIEQVRTNSGSPEGFDAQVKATGMTLDQWRDLTIQSVLCRRILLRDTTNGIVIPDADVRKFYDDNPEKFQKPERARVAHIMILTWDRDSQSPLPPEKKKEKYALAVELKGRAEKGEDFAALAKKFSDDPASKDRGGEDTIVKGQRLPGIYASALAGNDPALGLQVSEFETAAFTLKVGQVSDPVETKYAYHIIKLLEKIPASKEEFDKAAPAIRDWLIEQKAEKAVPAYLAKLKEGAEVKILNAEAGAPKATP